MTAGTDTALAHRLLEAGLVDPLLLQGCLGEVRSRRAADPEVSLALLLVERRIVPAQQLEALLYGHEVSLEGGFAEQLPSRFGEFEVVRELERGGMGAVLEVRGPQGNRLALKTLLPGGAGDSELRARFRREAELTARLDHPHVVRIHAANLEVNPPYLVLDHLPGGTLGERTAAAQGLPLEEALGVTLKLASALQHAHARGVLHRDLKPENVLFDDRGEPRIIDWGLARSVAEVSQHLTQTGTLLGTPAYMAPEQALAVEAVGPAADVYSLGAVLYACLCGAPPFGAPQLLQTLDQVIHAPPPLPSRSVDLGPQAARVDALVARLLAKEPEARPGLSELSEELRALARGDAEAARPRPWGLALLVTLALVAVLGVALALGTAPSSGELVQEHLAWEGEHLSGYSLGVAPVPSAAELEAARERFGGLRISDEQRTLSLLRFEAHAGLLEVLAGRKPPRVEGAPGALLAAVAALRQGDLRATRRLATRALSLAPVGSPLRAERRAAQALLLRSAPDLATLQALAVEHEAEEGLARASLRERGAELVVELLGELPREGEAWPAATHRVREEVALARNLALPAQTWQAGLELAAPRWVARLETLSRLQEADDLAFALERLDPPGLGPQLRAALQATVDRFVDQGKPREGRDREEVHRALAIALRIDETLAYVDSAYRVTPRTRDLLCRQHNGLDPGSTPELSTDLALFALRNSTDLNLGDIRSHINGPRLEALAKQRPRPRSEARALASLLDASRGLLDEEVGEPVLARAKLLESVLERRPSDLSASIRALSYLWLAEHYERLATLPEADALAFYELAARAAQASLEDMPRRKRGNNRVHVAKHLARLAYARGGPAAAAEVWPPVILELRADFASHEEDTAQFQNARLALAWSLIAAARFRLEAGQLESVLELAREAERLTVRRYGWENWLPQAYELQAYALHAQGESASAWAALHFEPGLFGSSTAYATLALTLGVELGKQEEVTRAYHATFLRPWPKHERDSRKRYSTLEEKQREEVLARGRELGYSDPPRRYRGR